MLEIRQWQVVREMRNYANCEITIGHYYIVVLVTFPPPLLRSSKDVWYFLVLLKNAK